MHGIEGIPSCRCSQARRRKPTVDLNSHFGLANLLQQVVPTLAGPQFLGLLARPLRELFKPF